MAELHVQVKKRGVPVWVWVVVFLIVVGAVALILVLRNNDTTKNTIDERTQTSTYVQTVRLKPVA